MVKIYYHIKFANDLPERIYVPNWLEFVVWLNRAVSQRGPVEWMIRD